MSDETKLVDAVRIVCRAHYDERRDCAECPIRRVCHSGPTGVMSADPLQQWRERMNAAAAEVLRQKEAQGAP